MIKEYPYLVSDNQKVWHIRFYQATSKISGKHFFSYKKKSNIAVVWKYYKNITPKINFRKLIINEF